MIHADLNRLQDDMKTIKHAAGVGLPFGREDVRNSLWLAVCGILVFAWALLGPWAYRWVVLVPLSLALLSAIRASMSARRQRGPAPASWREKRLEGIVALVVMPLVIGYMKWERELGIPRETIGAASMFFLGVGLLAFAVVNRTRLFRMGEAIPLMAFGLAIPFCTPVQVVIVGGLCLTVSGLATAGIQQWQLRNDGNDRDAN